MPGRERDIRLRVISEDDPRGLVRAANNIEDLGRGVDRAGAKFRQFESDTKKLGVEIERTKAHIKDLQLQIAKHPTDFHLFGDLNKEERRLSNLMKVFKALLPDPEDGKNAGTGFISGFVKVLGGLPSQVRGLLIAGIVTTAPVVAPFLGAAIAGAVTGTVGVGGIAGGIAAASKDPKVRAAATHFGESISHVFFTSGGAFVEPIIDSLGILEDAFKDLDLGDAFEKLAPFVDDLAQGLGGLARNVMPGLNEAFDNLGPFLHVIAKELPELGADFGSLLGDLSESEGAITGLTAAFNTLENVLAFTGDAISFLSDRFQEFIIFMRNVAVAAEDVLHVMGLVNPSFKSAEELAGQAADSLERLAGGGFTVLGRTAMVAADILESQTAHGLSATGDAASKLKAELDAANKAISETARIAFSAENATLRFEEGLDRLRESAKKGNRQLGVFNDEGRENRRTLQDIVQAAYDARDAIISEGNGTETARRKGDEQFNAMIAKAREVALKLKLPKGAVDALIQSLNKVPASKNTKFNTPGLTAAQERVRDLQNSIRNLHDKTVRINVRTFYSGGRPLPMQHGGEVYPGHAYVVGEKRPELFIPDTRGRIEPKLPTTGRAAMGGNTYAITVNVAPGGDLREAGRLTVRAIQSYERANGSSWRAA